MEEHAKLACVLALSSADWLTSQSRTGLIMTSLPDVQTDFGSRSCRSPATAQAQRAQLLVEFVRAIVVREIDGGDRWCEGVVSSAERMIARRLG